MRKIHSVIFLIILLAVGLALAIGCTPPGQPPSQTPSPTGFGNLQLSVKDTDNNPLWGAKVVSTAQPAGQAIVNGITTQPGGTMVFSGIRAGAYQFSISRSDYEPRSVNVTVVAGQTAELSVIMSRTSPSPVIYSLPRLKYRLLSNFNDIFWCDPDYYPVARPGQEEKNALEQFPTIRANPDEFTAILEHLGLKDKPDYTDAEKLSIYREHKELTYAVQVTASGNAYAFTLRTGQGQGFRIEGTIAPFGELTVLKQETSFNTCPICLSKGTLIDTPDGPLPVERVSEGMMVWTLDGSGKRIASLVLETVVTPVPPSFEVVRVTLKDGRTVSASPGHPTAEGRALGDYQVGDTLNGATITKLERVTYDDGATYDLLPSGATGLYWANGILLKSTLWPGG